MSFELSPEVNRKKLFLVKYKELEDRFDPYYYKDEFKLLIEAIKNTGHAKTLKSLNAYIKKGVFDMSPDNYTEQGIPFLRVADITFDGMDFSSTVFIDEKTHREQLNTEFLPGDIVIAKIGHTIGKVSVLPNRFPKYNISQNVVGIKIPTHLKSIVSSEYLKLFLTLNNGKKQVIRQSSHGAQPKITLDALRKILIPILDVNKQKVVVAHYKNGLQQKKQKEAEAQQLLDSIDDYLLAELGIELPEQEESTVQSRIFTRRLSNLSGGRFDSNFYKAIYLGITNAIKTIQHDKLSHFVQFSSETWNQKDIFTSTFPYIEIGEINLRFGEIKNIGQTNIAEAPSRAKMIVRGGDILISTTRPSRGAIVKIEETDEIYIASTGFSIIRNITKPNIDSTYLHYILRQVISLKQMEQRSSGGNYPAITQEELGNLLIPLPPLEKQKEIANHITQIRNQAKQLQQQAKTELEQAKKQVEAMILGEA